MTNMQFSEDAMMIARNILSGNNVCGTLKKAMEANDHRYFAAAAEPVLATRRDEMEHMRKQRDNISRKAEEFRFVLELLAQNMTPGDDETNGMRIDVNANMLAVLEKALGRKMIWDSG